KGFFTAIGVGKVGIATVDDNVSRFQIRHHGIDHLIHRLARFYHHHDAARRLQETDKLLNGMSANDVCTFRFVVEEIVHLRNGPVEDRDLKPMVVHVEHEVLTHYGQTNQSDITSGSHVSPV